MTPKDAFIELCERLGTSNEDTILVNEEELRQWPEAAVKAMKFQKLIIKARPASSALCPGCEHNCVMPVHGLPETADAQDLFVVCDKRDDINRVVIATEQLSQWKCNADLVCRFVANSLGLHPSNKQLPDSGLREIGIAFGDKRSQMLCLQANGILDMVAGNNSVPLIEVIEYHDNVYSIDGSKIRQLVDSSTTADPRYTPSNIKREARKQDTQARYEIWNKAYRNLKIKRPNMSDVWYSQQIAKMDIANGRNAETILKKMKK